MKYIHLLPIVLGLLMSEAYGQTTYYIRADSTRLQKIGGNNELIIENKTRDTLGVLVNTGNGRTAFQRGRISGDTLFLGRDTIVGIGSGSGLGTGVLTPDPITGNADNYNPTGWDESVTTLRISADADGYNITGLEGGAEGRIVILHNVGTWTITLTSEDGDSDADNQFLFSSNVSLAANTSILLRYDGTSQRWRDATNYGGQSLLFARTDARNETGAAMSFSAAGENFEIDSIATMDIISQQFEVIAATDEDVEYSDLLLTDVVAEFKHEVVDGVSASFYVSENASVMSVSDDSATSDIRIAKDSILIRPHLGNIHIDSLDHIPNPSTYKMMVWDSASGHVATRLLPSGGGTPAGSTTEVQFNNAGSFGADGAFTFSNADNLAALVVGESGGSRGAIVFQNASNAFTLYAPGSGDNEMALPTNAGTSGQVLTKGSGNTTSWEDAPSGGGITIGTTTITSGTNTRILYNNSGVVGEMTTSGSGTQLALTAGPTFTGTVTLPTLTATNAIITNASGSSAANVGIIGNNTSTAVSGAQFQVEGSTNTNLRMYMYGSSATTLGVGNNYATAVFGSAALTEAASGTHPLISTMILKAPAITGGSATATNGATLYIEGAPSGTFATGTNSLYIAAGGVRFGAFGAGNAVFDASGNISSSSDGRLKNIQGSYNAGLKELMQIDPIIYKWKPGTNMETAHSYAGFDARNIHNVLGDVASGKDEKGYYTIQDRALIAMLINAVKEQQEQINQLKRKRK